MGKIAINNERCKGCDLCVHFCPKQVILHGSSFNSKGHRPPKFQDDGVCTGCAICARICPDVAIEVWR
ncbi:MAG: ferredoxin family protein [Armatimonadota bacterium]|nr:ferredoxin family protein [Armatimonadota bacterium]